MLPAQQRQKDPLAKVSAPQGLFAPSRAGCPARCSIWTSPVISRVDLLAAGVPTDSGVKVCGPPLAAIARGRGVTVIGAPKGRWHLPLASQ
jgi:hypothetical protein